MSFSSDVKNELARIVDKGKEVTELSAYVRIQGIENYLENGTIELKTENPAVARRIYTFVKGFYEDKTSVEARKNTLKKNNTYTITIRGKKESKDFLKKVGVLEDGSYNFYPPKLKANEKRAYVRAAFLAGGSITNPEKGYHFEIYSKTEENAEGIKDILSKYEINPKIISRKNTFVVYVKEGEKISDCLNIMGAVQALLKYENVRAMKDFRNGINRKVNLETANLTKTVESSLRQVKAIERIEEFMGIDSLPVGLREVCYLRLENKELSLAELGKLMTPPQTKAVVNQRLRRIEKISEGI
ncbi:MAG: DNA-binding protein WhiA [Tissierellia bacterium]|nr:DNA-binding protein WhiA [Tissierellia bacterium]